MALFDQRILETRVYEMIYRVEAENEEDAENLIAVGDTVSETMVKLEGVVSRDPFDDIIKLSD